MSVAVRRFEASDLEGIDRLNERLQRAGVRHVVYPEAVARTAEPDLEKEPIIQRLFVVADGREVHGGVWLKEQHFWTRDKALRVGWAKYPVSESLVDGNFAGVPSAMVFALLRHQPYLMALGMGGHESPYARLLAKAGWGHSSVPFFYRLVRPARVLRQLTYVRRTLPMRVGAEVLARTGLGWLGYHALAVLKARRGPTESKGYGWEVVDAFGTWADAVWEACRGQYAFLAVRDRRVLNVVYPSTFEGLARLRVVRGGRDVGWICAQTLDMSKSRDDRRFGSLRLGILTDCFGALDDAPGIVAAGVQTMLEAGVDLIITYQTHRAWCRAVLRNGFFTGPSTQAFYRSPAVEALITETGGLDACHVTRSDGDGPKEVRG